MRSEPTHHAAASALAAAMIAELRTDETFLSLHVQNVSLCNALQSLLMEYSISCSSCILQYVLDLPPGLDLHRLKAAWNCVVASCEILRTRIFSTVKGAIQTVVEESSSWDCDNSLQAYLSRDLKIPMGYGSPLSRWGIIGEQKGATERFMVLSLHQSIHDDRTVTVLLERLCREYEALGEGGGGSGRHVPQISLDGSVQLPTADQDAKNESIPAWWKAEAVRDSLTGVDWISQQVCASSVVEHEAMILGLNMSTPHLSQVLYSAWAITISTYAQASDVTFGTVVFHRDQSTYDGVSAESTSPEIALLPVRISVEQADTTMQLLDQVSKIDYSRESAEMPWTGPLASLLCIRDPVPKAFRCGDQILSLFRPTTRKYPCPLTLECHGGQYLRVVGHFDESIFTTQRVRCLLQQFVHVVRQLSISSHSPRVQDVEVLSPEDKQQIWAWNGRPIPSVNRCLHHVFEEVAARHPSRIAVNAWDGVLTYQQLDEQSTRLAHQLQKIGVGPEIIVALYLDKSKQVPVSILGVQKAGGACLTFDTQQPVSRLRSILSDGRIAIMLTDRSHVSLCESLVPRVICVDEPALKSLPQPLTLSEGALRTGKVQPFNRAFVLYTSGSTGTPKGIDVPHSAMCTSTLAFAQAFNVSSDSRIFQYSSYGFDASAGDMFLAVLHGACLCIPSEYDRVNQLEHSICHLKANWLCTTPSVLGLLDPDNVPCLETLAIGGEALPKNITLQWAPRLRFHTGYGPSETGVLASVLEVQNNQHPYSNVGRAMACHHWIVSSDDCNRLAPLGCPGELVIEGPTVSRGYLNRPELTARAFPRQPAWFDRQVGRLPSRFYRTGDIARHNDDGTLTFLGRRDAQIKYHGQRIEPGDIEFSINQHELVREAVVLYPSDGPYAGRLTAVVALDKDFLSSPSSDEAPLLIDPGMLQRQLENVRTSTQTELPPYMWPTEWLLMSRPSLNMNGKLNRKEILNSVKKMTQEVSQTKQPPPDASRPLTLSQSPFIDESEHLSQGQQVLLMQCSAILQLHRSQVPMESTFVSLGGDSLTAIQLVTACRKKGVEIDVRDILRGVRLKDVPYSAPGLSRAVSLAPQQPGPHAENCTQGIDMFDAFGLSPQSVSSISGIPSHDIQAIYPCLSMQQGILTSRSRDQTLYQTAHVFEITGRANQEAMWDMQTIISAWRMVIERHDALRAVFLELPTHTEHFAQVILRHPVVQVTQHSSKHEILSLSEEPFPDFKPPHRLRLAPAGKDAFVCKLEMSHAITDGSSMDLIFRDLVRVCAASNPLPEAVSNTSYGDYIRYLRNQDRDAGLEYWMKYLQRTETCHLKLPTSNHPSAPPKLQSYSIDIPLEQSILVELRRRSLTIADLLQLTWATVLRLYTDQREACFGYISSGRAVPVDGIRDAVGPFINLLTCRLAVDYEQTPAQLMLTQKDDFISSIPHQHVSLGDIWHAVGISGVGPFNTLISILNATGPELGIETKMTLKSLEVYDPTEYELTVTSYLSPGLATVRFDYWSDKASSDSINRLAHTFRHVFQTAGSTLDSPLKSLCLISDMDFRQIVDWNSNTPLAVEKCIHEVISSRSSTAPQSPALCSWDGELTYREMDAISDTVAQSLRSMGVREEVAVPLCFHKSFWAVVAMIAVLKAGGAIVPLDPSHPISRRLEICRQVKAQMILVPSDGSIQAEWSESQLRMVEISHLRYQQLLTEKPTGAGCLQIGNISRSSPAHSAYIVFTSGTTGVPKGIVTEHGAFCSGVAARAKAIMRSSKTRTLQFASFAFDTCLEDILTTLMQGGCVCLPSEQERLSDLPGAIRRMNVNTAELTPSVARLLQPKDVPSLETLILGGEQVTADIIMQWSEAVTLINSYGPAECSVTSVVSPPYELEAKDRHASNIGLGVGALTWVVDSQNPNQLVPIGAVGELLLEGPVLARGYHDRQDLTDANFITDPACLRQSQPRFPRRFYRTGDLVQYAPDGSLICLGRRDDQIKLHGQRIELDEVDSCLQLHYPGRRLIVAFFSKSLQPWQTETDFNILPLSGSIREEIINLQNQVASSLPIYMRPSLYIPASRIPTNTAGKKDRATLAKAVQTLTESQYLDYSLTSASGHHQPETPEQRMLQSLWSQLLKLPPQRIGIHDDFFQIGGDSILAMKLSSLVGKRETVLSVADVFRYPTLREMAARLTGTSHSHPLPALSKLVDRDPTPFSLLPCSWPDEALEEEIATACQVPRDNIEDVYPCSAVQEGLMALSMRQKDAYTARLVYSISPGTSLARLQYAWQLVASRHSLLRTRIMLSRRFGTLQVVLRADDAGKDTVAWKNTHCSDLQSFLEEDKGVPMTYGSTLSRCAIVTTPDQAKFFVWTVHHALYDGWLLPTIIRRAAEAYLAEESAAAWSIIPFRCFIAYLETRDRSASEGYWTNQLDGFRQVEFPARNMGSKKERRDMSKVYHRIRLGRRPSRRFTTAIILRAAWAFLISKYSESDDVSFGVTLSGRTAPVEGIASIAGPTLTTVPVRVRIDSEQSVVEFLRNMQSQATEMMPHEHTGLQRIRKLSQGCLEACDFQNLLVIQPADEKTESTAEHSVFGLPVDEAAANSHFHTYPLVLSCTFSEHEVDLEVICDPTTISPVQAERLALHFDAIFQTFWLFDEGVTVGQVEMITRQDREQIQTWNKEQPQPQPRLVHEVIEEQVLLHPDSEAVYAWDGSLTYRDLHRYSSQLARTLQMEYHVGPERLVPVLFEKSVWAVVAMLGVMMAGGGFVPLDVSHPLDRMNDIVAQCNADLALVSSETSGTPLCTASKLIVSENMFRGLDAGGHETDPYSTKIPDVRPAHYFPGLQPQFLDTSKQEPGDQTSERTASPRDSSPRTPVSFSWHSAGPETSLAFDMLTPGSNISERAAQPDDSDLTESDRVQPQNVVYVIFTSGSTGKPKGVVIQHDQFCSGVLGPRQEALLRSEQSRVLQFASFSFDTSLEDIITTLFFGGCVCIPSEDDRMNDIAGFINKSKVNTAHITPSFANTLSPQLVPGLKYLRLGGERMTPTHIDKWAPALELRNVYGPTETCITATCSGTVTTASDPIDIGRGVAALTWIVNPDNHHQLTPVGLVGELLVEGPLLARGYLGDINKTNASFITDATWARTPENPKSPRRFYKTGDLVRYSEAGTLLYIGRKDTQVKIYGQRIEIGEIEDHLKKALLPQTIEMAVEVTSLQADTLQRKVLVAFLCLDDSFNKDGAVLMSLTPAVKKRVQDLTSKLVLCLSKTLPAYMIPSRYVPLRSMPRTLAGKADRRKLQHLLNSMSTEDLLAYSLEGGEKQPVESETEFQLQKLWAEVLSVDTMMIGSHDSFFRLGGDSITAIRLAAALRDEGMFLTVGDIFNHPELRHMAAQIDAQDQGTKPVPGATPGTHEDLHAFGLLAPSPTLLFDLSKVWDIPEDTVQDVYPCTPLQIELLAAEGRHSQSTYGSQAAYDLPLDIDLDRFKHAVETVFRQNDILRTRIVYLEPHGTVQVVTKDGGLRWEYEDGIDQVLTQGFSFGLGTSLVRVALCPNSHESAGWTFVLTMHHSLYDGWSLSLILQQVNEVYQFGFLSSERPRPRFSDFIGHLGSLDPDLSSQYWASILTQSSGSSDLPSQNGTVEELDSVEEYHYNMPRVEQEGSRLEVTPAIVLRAAWALVITAYTGNSDVRFGLSVAGRNVPVKDIDQMVGPTLTTIPCRLQINQDWTVEGFLNHVNQSMIAAIPHEHFGLQRIAKLGTDCSRCCDFDSLLVVQPQIPAKKLGIFASSRSPSAISRGNDQPYPVVVECDMQEAGGWKVHVFYRKAFISASSLQRIVYLMQHLVEQLYLSPNMRLADLSLVSPTDLGLIASWNASVPTPVDTTMSEMLYTSTKQHADLPAIHAWDDALTYSQLVEQFQRLSHYLRLCGVQRGSFVPVVMPKSALYIISVLAVISEGAAFVPIDATSTPRDRMMKILEQCNATVVIASTASASDILESGRLRVLRISHQLLRRLPDGPPAGLSRPEADDPLYCVFTSGTTGSPKGVVVTHGAYASSTAAKQKAFELDETTRVLQFSSNAFDASIDDIFISLLSGSCLCVPSEAERRDSLSQFIVDTQVNYAAMTPTVARTLDVQKVSQCLTKLRLGGEKLTSADLTDWVGVGVNLKSLYGPTESCVCCSASSSLLPEKTHPANIGRGLACRTWIVDVHNPDRLAPIGAVGELVIEGPALAKEYLHDLERTSRAFIHLPLWLPSIGGSSPSKSKGYKTGDTVRYSEDGSLIYVGRKDTQVKLRGMRLELEEVQHALRDLNLPGVQDLVVEILPQSIAPDILAADILMLAILSNQHRGEEHHLDAIRANLTNRLPEYMIPTHLLLLDSLPTSSSGKTDRLEVRRLAVEQLRQQKQQQQQQQCSNPDDKGKMGSHGVEAPMDIFRTLQSIWADILQHDLLSIGPNANFFQLGGDSILVMRLVAHARAHSIDISSADVHQLQTLSAIVAKAKLRILPRHRSTSPPDDIDVASSHTTPDLRLISLELGILEGDIEKVLKATDFQSYCLAQTFSPSRGWLNFFSYDLQGNINVKQLEYACHALVQRHEILRARFVALHGCIQQVIPRYRAEHVHFQVHEGFSDMHGLGSLASLVHNDPAPSLNDGLVRFVLHIVHPGHIRLTMRISHAQYDGLSMPIILNDLDALYNGIALAPPARFSEYVEESERLLSQNEHAQQFWCQLLQGSQVTPIVVRSKLSSHSLPKDCPLDQTAMRTIRLSRSTFDASITPATIIKAAWALVLGRLSQHQDVVFGHLTSTRPSLDHLHAIHEVVGPCLNVLPVRVQLQPTTARRELLDAIQQQYIGALPHSMLGFREIIDHCTQWPPCTRFSSILQYQNLHQDLDRVLLGGATGSLEAYVPASDAADLWMMVTPTDDCGAERLHEVKLSYSAATIPSSLADRILDEFDDAISFFQAPHASDDGIRLHTYFDQTAPEFPPTLPIDRQLAETDLPPRAAIIAAVKGIWEQVFGPQVHREDTKARKEECRAMLHTPFGPDPVSAAQLSLLFQQAGVEISPAEAAEYPTIFQQSLLWGYKMREGSR
ncbi:acetyl-CoA synthetase-like protein [Aspergillus japonicus CBS 114.51]|uniref:Acetyl-CoA synthetase-like protein n=1 Tax=Aspergillus japonicus CBS 114.51 TaxID=1448312 RepID=A0A8T8WS53_ASPJA|nr:acetyl-CoA synthetase-like protein [Aspergillus japonicus CBS 114.51]RAH78382.1 acetyl-CoA synthetase-like protein [Aspergillus japonicus CBS 114.51]